MRTCSTIVLRWALVALLAEEVRQAEPEAGQDIAEVEFVAFVEGLGGLRGAVEDDGSGNRVDEHHEPNPAIEINLDLVFYVLGAV